MNIQFVVLCIGQRMPDVVSIQKGMSASAKADPSHPVLTDNEYMGQASQATSFRQRIEPADYRSSGNEPMREERVQNVNDREP